MNHKQNKLFLTILLTLTLLLSTAPGFATAPTVYAAQGDYEGTLGGDNRWLVFY